jgi:hypothetical protein
MSTFTKLKLSNSINGRGIRVSATSTPGTLIHTASTTTTDQDEIWLQAYNSGSSTVTLTVVFGGVTVPDDNIVLGVPSKAGLYVVVPGDILSGSPTAPIVRAFASTGSLISLFGYVNRIGA